MARYASFKYGAEKYGATSLDNIIWGLDIDWDDDGAFSGTNEGDRLQGVQTARGRNYLLSSGGDGFEPVQVGTATLVLTNYDGRYDPYNAASPLYPNVAPGRLIRLRVRYGTTIYPVYAGVIQDIQPSFDDAGRPTVTLNCEDGLRWLQDYSATTGVYQSTWAHEAIDTLLASAQWPTAWGSSLSNGADLLDYWWGKDRSVYDEIRALSDSELARFYCDAAGAFVFQNRQTAPASVATIDQSQMLKSVALSQPWEIQRNACTVISNPIAADTLDDIWTYGGVLAIGAGATLEIFAEFGGAAVDVVPPVATTDYLANRSSDGLSTNLTAYISVGTEVFSEGARLTIINGYSLVAYITLLKVRGRLLVSSGVSASATATGYAKHPRTLKLDLEWQQDTNNPAIFATQLLTILNTAPALPQFQIETRPDVQFALDLFDVITVTIARLSINSAFRVGYISHEWTKPNGQAIITTIKTEPHWAYPYWIFDDGVLDTTPLGW